MSPVKPSKKLVGLSEIQARVAKVAASFRYHELVTQPVVDILGKKLSKLEPLREKILKGHKIKETDGGKILLNEIFERNKSCFILRNWKGSRIRI